MNPPTERVEGNRSEGWSPIQGAFWRAGAIAPGFEFERVLPKLTDEAVQQIHVAGEEEKPFFLYFALPAPHTPWVPLDRYRDTSDAGLYGDFVVQVDHTVGRIMEALREAGVEQNTLIIFTSDNGPVWYQRDRERFGHASTGRWRGMKGDAWEGGHRMPFIARWPGEVPKETTSHARH